MKTSIGKRGYTILKEELTSSQIYEIRQELTVKAFVNQDYGVAPTPFPVYCESARKQEGGTSRRSREVPYEE